MSKNTYKLAFLPLFKEDLLEVVDYISVTLQNPDIAHRLVDDIELAIVKRLEMTLAFAPYQSAKLREQPYYRINVRNFSVFTSLSTTLWKYVDFYMQNEILMHYSNSHFLLVGILIPTISTLSMNR